MAFHKYFQRNKAIKKKKKDRSVSKITKNKITANREER